MFMIKCKWNNQYQIMIIIFMMTRCWHAHGHVHVIIMLTLIDYLNINVKIDYFSNQMNFIWFGYIWFDLIWIYSSESHLQMRISGPKLSKIKLINHFPQYPLAFNPHNFPLSNLFTWVWFWFDSFTVILYNCS